MVPYWFIHTNIQHYKFQQPGNYDFSEVTFSSYIAHILGKLALLHFRTPLGLGLGLRQSFQPRFFMMSHQ